MLLQNLRAKIGARLDGTSSESGFTLIELLVVMLILGILAAIALPAFFNQKDKAGDAKAKESVHSAQVAMETCATDNNNDYATCDQDALAVIEPTIPTEAAAEEGEATNPFTITPGTPTDGYTITVEAQGGGNNTFTLERDEDGALTYSCETANSGGCPEGGNWGE